MKNLKHLDEALEGVAQAINHWIEQVFGSARGGKNELIPKPIPVKSN